MGGGRWVRAIRIAELVAIAALGLFAWSTWHELALLRQVPVALPSYEFEVGGAPEAGSVVRTRGTWVAETGLPEPLQTTTIECHKSRMECVESAASVVFVSERGLLESRQTVFQVARWSDTIIVSRPAEQRCWKRTLVLDLSQKRAMTQVSASEDDGPCRAAPARTLELVTGYKVRAEALQRAKGL